MRRVPRPPRRPAGLLASVAAAVAATVLAGCASAPTGPPPPSSGSADPPAPCSPTTSLAGWSDALEGASFRGQDVASLSGLAARPDGTVLAIVDRSTLLTLDAAATRVVDAQTLADESGRPLDAEAVVDEPGDTRLVSDENGPAVRRYGPDGRLVGALPLPRELAGRGRANKTLEGLARQPDGSVVAAYEEALTGDDRGLTRLVTWTPAGDPWAQYALVLPAGVGVSDIAAVGDGRLLVVQRGYDRSRGNTVRLLLADPRGAADVRGVRALTPGVPTVPTTLLADLGTCPPLGATARGTQTNPLLDNVEGLTITGRDPDGALRLLLVSDDNGSASQTTRTYRLSTRLPA